MAYIANACRRGAVYGWRRHIALSASDRPLFTLSVHTRDPAHARRRAAALTVTSEHVRSAIAPTTPTPDCAPQAVTQNRHVGSGILAQGVADVATMDRPHARRQLHPYAPPAGRSVERRVSLRRRAHAQGVRLRRLETVRSPAYSFEHRGRLRSHRRHHGRDALFQTERHVVGNLRIEYLKRRMELNWGSTGAGCSTTAIGPPRAFRKKDGLSLPASATDLPPWASLNALGPAPLVVPEIGGEAGGGFSLTQAGLSVLAPHGALDVAVADVAAPHVVALHAAVGE